MKLLNHASLNQETDSSGLNRRSFLTATGGAVVGLVVGFAGPAAKFAAAGGSPAAINPFVRIGPDGTVTVLVKHLDKGQGTLSALTTLVAEELDADWDSMRAEFAPADNKLYNNLFWGETQGTGGSSGVPNSFMQYRQAGAAAKAMLRAAASKAWGVPPGEVKVAEGVLSHASGKSASFGEMAAAAAGHSPPESPELKTPDQFRLIGNAAHRRIDTPAKTRGEATYTQDVQLPGMLVAVLQRPPKFGATAAAIDDSASRAIKGVVDVVSVPRGVAVLATNTWSALQGRDALNIEWDETNAETRSTSDLVTEYRALLDQEGPVAADAGDIDAGFAKAAHIVESTFEFPYLAHAPMEPLNAVADLKPGQSLEVWTGSQLQTGDHAVAAAIAGLPLESVKVHTLFAGGSFGRRATPNSDMVAEAVQVAMATGGRAPVKVVWSREDDIQGGFYRPLYLHKVKAGVDGDGQIVAWHHRIVGQSILKGTPFEAFFVKDGIDGTSVEGAAELPYALGAHRLELHTTDVGVPVLWWRSVGSTHTAYAVETMMDRLAAAAGQDPVAFRLKALKDNPREHEVLRLAAEKAGWGKKSMPAGLFRGAAVHKSFGSYVAQVADVRLREDGTVKVEKVVCAIDCGVAVTPDQIAAQMEGGIGYGLGAILRNRITLSEGAVEQSQFFDYEPLRISDMPHVETHIVPSAEAPTGVGEPGTPPIGPAVANAIFAATGRQIDSLPFTDHGLV